MAPTEPVTNSEISTPSELPSMTTSERDEIPEIDYIEGPVQDLNIVSVKERIIMLPSVESARDIGNDSELQARRQRGLEIGIGLLSKPYLKKWKSASRRVQNDIFPTEFGLLDRTLYSVLVGVDDADRMVYTLCKEKYVKLIKQLQKRKEAARDSFNLQGLGMPRIPSWGNDYGCDSWLSLNDYEVAAICFRAEVEFYLQRLEEIHDFDLGRRKGGNSLDSDDDCDLYEGQHVDSISGFKRDIPPHISRTESEEVASMVIDKNISGKGKKNSDISAIKRNQSAYLRYRGDEERLSNVNKGNRLPKNAKLREVMQGSKKDQSESFERRDKDDRTPKRPSPLRKSTSPDNYEGSGEEEEEESGKPIKRKINRGGPPSDDDPSDSSDASKPPRRPTNKKPVQRPVDPPKDNERSTKEPQFDLKLKIESVPKWDGNTDNIIKWFARINDIATLSETIREQLGRVVPKRLEGPAETWYFSLPTEHRKKIEKDWDSLKEALGTYYMNRRWLDRQKSRANRAYYREQGYPRELPSEYVIRKAELLRTVYSMDDTELIMEIMEAAPTQWNTVLTTQLYRDIVEFQNAIHFHEDTLVKFSHERKERYDYGFKDRSYSRNDYRTAHTRLVGWSNSLPPPKFPKDDSNVSKRATPESKGARPCRHCGSGKHWDPECKHSYQSNRRARTHRVASNFDPEDVEAQEEYENMYYNLDSEEEEYFDCNTPSSDDEGSESLRKEGDSSRSYLSKGFRPNKNFKPNPNAKRYNNDGKNEEKESKEGSESIKRAEAYKVGTAATDYVETSKKPVLNRRSRRRLAREISRMGYHTHIGQDDQSLIELRRIMGRPPGCSFLGARATQTEAYAGSMHGDVLPLIVDSGSDITLISLATLQALTNKPKIKAGQKINLIQVTGNSVISGYVVLDLYFKTPQGPVKINVEAYVVKGMTTPFILGNDFADQYSISIVRREGKSYLLFGNSGRELPVENTTSVLEDEEGHTFKVRISNEPNKIKAKLHKRAWRVRKRRRAAVSKGEARAARRTVIPPETSASVELRLDLPDSWDKVFVEKNITTNEAMDLIYGNPDVLLSTNKPFIHIANFSKYPITIPEGHVIGIVHNPRTWLDRSFRGSDSKEEFARGYAALVSSLANNDEGATGLDSLGNKNIGLGVKSETLTARSITEISSKAQRNNEEPDDPLAEEPVEGGPKTVEVPEETDIKKQLLKEVDISPDLTSSQKIKLERILLKNENAFGINGRLGSYDIKVEILLKPDTKPISLPPFPASPANREVIDKQMDSWISLGVIEPSKSPWGAPAFITYRNGKPRMVIDLRRLNETVIPDEFPIPRQDDILQALSGSQWLTTLDALAGFTQLSMSDSSAEKLAFRTHRGLWQFRRMPFGYRNGPSVFQRVMQGVLAPFLWIFALVYIDDIVIFSKTFEDHMSHLDQVLSAIIKAKMTLSPSKCHLGYQSLLLLGQKVSRLGLSTHKEKVDAIVELTEPRNKQELQTFLGMMVYFSQYIPFYSWIAQPFFKLLKKDAKWEWNELHDEAFELCKKTLTNAPVRGYPMPGNPYRVYTDACDFGLAGILQQVQPIKIKDLRGTKSYEKLFKAYQQKEPVPQLVIQASKDFMDVPKVNDWAKEFEDTIVYVERVVAYWSRILKSAERNYSPTEREALALKEALIKFQPLIEGEDVVAITDHAALTWSRTYQNVNRRLLTWGTVFSAYPKLKIVHRAGRVHSNVDPVSRLRRRMPRQESPEIDQLKTVELKTDDPMKDMYEELSPRLEEGILNFSTRYVRTIEEDDVIDSEASTTIEIELGNDDITSAQLPYRTSKVYSVLIGLSDSEVEKWKTGYTTDPHFKKVLERWEDKKDELNPYYPQYIRGSDGLIYLENWDNNKRICVPEKLKIELMDEIHNSLTETAHGGYHKCYNKLATLYYWPRMSRDVKRYVTTCDICQKAKPKRHAPIGLLRPIPIPTQPFEVVSMDFIPELPNSNGYDNILVIVDKLTKYGIFIPCNTNINEEETARLFFKHIISKFGIPRQVISDRDTRWRNDFWKQICKSMDMKRSLTTAYHPQADGQTEILNQTLEIALRCFVGPSRDDWDTFLDGFALAYNSTPHSATGFSPAYLLRGFDPITSSKLINNTTSIERPMIRAEIEGGDEPIVSETAHRMAEEFKAERNKAKEAILLSQAHQKRNYNKGRIITEFKEGDLVIINPHSLELLKNEKGRGKKLLMKYDGPFEVLRRISPVTYQIRLPASYGMHPILNIAHLEKYNRSPEELGDRPTKNLNRSDFESLPEYEVEKIIMEKWRKGPRGRRVPLFKTRFIGYGPEYDEWLTLKDLRNAPLVLKEWETEKGRKN